MEYLIYTNGGYCEFMGPSTATKPTTEFFVGAWVETDTGNAYFYDQTNGWVQQ